MTRVSTPIASVPGASGARVNVADRLAEMAVRMPQAIAVACPKKSSRSDRSCWQGSSGATYRTTTFAELDADATRIACGLTNWGVPQGTRLALLVRPGVEFVTLVFALLRAGMTIVLVDPGMGRHNLIQCLADAKPGGFVAIGAAQAARIWWRSKFPLARWNVTVGRRWFWGGMTLDGLRRLGFVNSANASNGNTLAEPVAPNAMTQAEDAAAIIFTSGSTGMPKGVLYTHRMFETQVDEIQRAYRIAPGGIDLGCFPLFALFNSAMGVTTVLPEMDFSRPASADPRKLLAAANDWKVTQAFASPAVWRIVSHYCAAKGERIPSLRQVFSCGAPVPADVLRETLACVADDAQMHTPYGATECLPVATIEAAEVFSETAARTDEGAGVCVGRRFDSIEWRVIGITDEPISAMRDAEELQPGRIGELVVRGPQASPRYVTRDECNAPAKIREDDESLLWHRMGDVGYFDDEGRFWYCGRKSQRVETAEGPMFTEGVEAIFNRHPRVKRTALVGIGECERQTPVVVVELQLGSRDTNDGCSSHDHHQLWQAVERELMEIANSHSLTKGIKHFLRHDGLPVDVRHNAKINREQLAVWAAQQLLPSPASTR